MGFNTPEIIDFLGPCGFDGAWVECEHGPSTWSDLQDLTRAADLWGLTSLVRVNQNDPALIGRTLDQGATGIVVPHVNTKEEAQRVVHGAKFSPVGQRGIFTSRQAIGVDSLTYFREVNDQILLVVLIEEMTAIDNLDEILAVDHIDVFFVASGDLAQTMGHVGQPKHPEVKKVVESTMRRIRQAGRNAGTVAGIDEFEYFTDLGANFVVVSWKPWIVETAKRYVAKVASLK